MSTDQETIYSYNKIGVNLSNPDKQFEVNGEARIRDHLQVDSNLKLGTNGAYMKVDSDNQIYFFDKDGIRHEITNDLIDIESILPITNWNLSTDEETIYSHNKIGINLSNPDKQFEVNGEVRIRDQLTVDSTINMENSTKIKIKDDGELYFTNKDNYEEKISNNDNDNLMHLSAWSMAPDENLYSYNSVSIGSSDILTGDNKLYVQGNITASGVVTASDFRLKKDIVSLENSLDKILKLNPVTFRWKNNDTKNNIGLIAQEVEDIIPDAVNENNEIKGIQYNAITAMLVKSVQELKSENQSLKDENQDLKQKLTNIFERLENAGI